MSVTYGSEQVITKTHLGRTSLLVMVLASGRKPLLILGTAGTTVSLSGIGVAHLLALPAAVGGYATLAGILAFIIFFAVGPGVAVWVVLSEILPTAIRGKGMAIALFANSLVSAGLAAIFATLKGWIGYSGTFFLLAFFVCLYFLVAVFPLTETKDRTLEEVETYFLSAAKTQGAGNG